MANNVVESGRRALVPVLSQGEVLSRLIELRGVRVLLDKDVAALYGVETRTVNQAVKRNAERFPEGYMFQLTNDERNSLKSQTVMSNGLKSQTVMSNEGTVRGGSRHLPYAFTEQGLYMLATILQCPSAVEASFNIIETFAAVRGLKRELLELHKENDPKNQKSKMEHFGEVLSDIIMPDLQTSETESKLEINFFIGKLTHTVKRVKK